MTARDELPDDIAELKASIRAQQDQNARLEALVASFKKALFAAKSEKTNPAQYDLEFEDIETAIAQVEAEIDAMNPPRPCGPKAPPNQSWIITQTSGTGGSGHRTSALLRLRGRASCDRR